MDKAVSHQSSVVRKLKKVMGYGLWVMGILILFLLITHNSLPITPVRAAISGCSANVSPTAVHTNSSATLNFNVTNNDPSTAVAWVQITSPSSRFQVTGGSSGGWSVSNDSSQVTFNGSTVGANSSQNFSVQIQTSSLPTGDLSWNVQASDEGGGGGAVSCGGSTAVTNSSDSTPPAISNVGTANITDTSATVTWTTDENSDSKVDYGPSAGYGSNTASGSQVTAHSINLTNLSAGTVFHFAVTSRDLVGNVVTSGDGTFTTTGTGGPTAPPGPTPAPGSTSPGSTSPSSSGSTAPGSTSTGNTAAGTAPQVLSDRVSPVISLTNDFSIALKSSPALSGTATDNIGVEKVEYSTDGGKNWLPVVIKKGIKVSFSSPVRKLDDGDYNIVLRAVDQAGNVGLSKPAVLVIDQFPPLIGPSLFTAGPQMLRPENNRIVSLAGVEQKVTLSAIGGTTAINLIATGSGLLAPKQFDFKKDEDSGLWSAIFNFAEAGTYFLRAQAADGAGNIIIKNLGQIQALKNGQISYQGRAVKDATMAVFYFDDVTHRFISWDSQTYFQDNPQTVDLQGHYKLLLPEGKYYLQIQAPGFQLLKTSIFSLSDFTPVNQNFGLTKKLAIGPFIFADFSQQNVQMNLSPAEKLEIAADSLLGKQLFDFSLNSAEETLNSVFLSGKPTVVSFLNSWLPQTTEQLENLEKLNQSGRAQVVVIMPQQSVSLVGSLKKSGGYSLSVFADPLGTVWEKSALIYTPAHLFVDRRGQVTGVKYGLLDSDELLSNLVD